MFVDIYNTSKKYDVIYADPPWDYKQKGSKNKKRGMAMQHYNTMSTDDICKIPVRNLTKDNSICLMWATFPNINQALKVMEMWGFIYKTAAFVWVKKNKKNDTFFGGMGAYTRANYRSDTNRPTAIQCEGVEDSNKISLLFRNLADKKEYMDRFCIKGYEYCRVFRAVYEQYR